MTTVIKDIQSNILETKGIEISGTTISKYIINHKKVKRLSVKQVHQICKYIEEWMTNQRISEITGVAKSNIDNIKYGNNWNKISQQYKLY